MNEDEIIENAASTFANQMLVAEREAGAEDREPNVEVFLKAMVDCSRALDVLENNGLATDSEQLKADLLDDSGGIDTEAFQRTQEIMQQRKDTSMQYSQAG